MHLNGCHENIELLLRTVISANQISIYGAIADLFNEVPRDLWLRKKPAAPDWKRWRFLPTPLEQLSEDQTLSKLCSDAGLKLVEQIILLYS